MQNAKSALTALPVDLFASTWIMERVPFIFADDRDSYLSWKRQLAAGLRTDPQALCIVGSAAFGWSLKPKHRWRPFRDHSDVDVAVISSRHFEIAWHTLRNLGTQKLSLNYTQRAAVREHKERHVFRGVIATERFLPVLPFGKAWASAFSKMAQQTPTAGRRVNARIYRDFGALREYQVRNLRETQRELNAEEST